MQKGSLDLADYSQKLAVDLPRLFAVKLSSLQKDGYIILDVETLFLTRKGVFFGNNIILDLLNIFAG